MNPKEMTNEEIAHGAVFGPTTDDLPLSDCFLLGTYGAWKKAIESDLLRRLNEAEKKSNENAILRKENEELRKKLTELDCEEWRLVAAIRPFVRPHSGMCWTTHKCSCHEDDKALRRALADRAKRIGDYAAAAELLEYLPEYADAVRLAKESEVKK